MKLTRKILEVLVLIDIKADGEGPQKYHTAVRALGLHMLDLGLSPRIP